MDYENKYKKALENARQEYNTTENVERKQWLEELFPELAESEDERIRKAIIKFLIDVNNGAYTKSELEIASWIAWLEKQGEPLNESVYDTEDKEIYQAISIGLTDVFNECGWSDFGGIPIENIQEWLEKQGEQKPAWSEEDELLALSIEHVMNCASLLNIVPEKVDKIRTWIKSLKQRMGGKV